MAIQITITIPGDVQDDTSAAGRLKRAIDWREEGIETAEDYRQIVQQICRHALQQYAKNAEIDWATQQAIASVGNFIDVETA